MSCITKNVLHTQGIRFQRNNGTAWEDVSQIKDITPAGGSRTTIDVTTIDQYNGLDPDVHKQYVGGLVEYDSFSLDMIIDPTSSAQRTLEADLYADNPVHYRIVFRNGWMRVFCGVVTSVKPTNGMDDVSRQTIDIKVSGKVELITVV